MLLYFVETLLINIHIPIMLTLDPKPIRDPQQQPSFALPWVQRGLPGGLRASA